MKNSLILLILLISSQLLIAQDNYHDLLFTQLADQFDLSGGTLVLNDTDQANIDATVSYGNISIAIPEDAENPFEKYFSITVNAEGVNPWDAGINVTNQNAVSSSDNILAVFWMKAESSSSTPQVSFFVEKSETFEKEIFFNIEPKEAWTQYMIPFSPQRNYEASNLVAGLHLAFAAQQIDYAGLTLINYGRQYTLQELPTQLNSTPYAGSEADAPWRAEAEARINQYRKADMKIQFVDMEGTPLKNWLVDVKMKRHEFEFGTAVNASLFADNANRNTTYEQKLENLDGKGNGFNTVVFENALKWRAWEGDWPTDKTGKVRAINWLANRDITMRGHNLLWPGWDVLPERMESNKNNASYLVNQIRARVSNMLTNPDIANNIRDWDVINEIAVIRDIENALKGTEGYITGREIYAEVFKQVKEIDPTLITYLNDYVTIGSNRDDGIIYNDYKTFIQEIFDAGGEIDGIGFQAHIGGSPTAPEKVYAILEDFYQEFGTEAKITEYDTDPLVSGDLGKQYMEDFLTIILSHQSVKGFLMWGFWDGAHWKDNSPMYFIDWSLKPAGEGFINKVFNDWWVDETIQLDGEGFLDMREFKGDYEFFLEDTGETFEFKLTGDTTARVATNLIISTSEIEFEDQFLLFPNPTNDLINITNRSSHAFECELIDQTGRILKQGSLSKNHQLDVSTFNSGSYFVRIIMDGDSFVKKIFKR